MTPKFVHKGCFVFVISILLLADLAILLNILFLRQILGFIFLTILPGLLILQILKLNEIESTEKFVLSVGLSISFLMFFGLLVNNLLLSFGYETPLSTIPFLISFNYFIKNPEESKRMGENARKKILAKYIWDAVARRCLEGYNELLKNRTKNITNKGGG